MSNSSSDSEDERNLIEYYFSRGFQYNSIVDFLTESGVMAALQCEFRSSSDAHFFGTSPANQRIESWWSQFRRSRSTWWINYFKDLVERGCLIQTMALKWNGFVSNGSLDLFLIPNPKRPRFCQRTMEHAPSEEVW